MMISRGSVLSSTGDVRRVILWHREPH